MVATPINIEDAQAAREDVEKALITLVSILRKAIERDFPEDHEVVSQLHSLIKEKPITLDLFRRALAFWAEQSD